MTESVRAGVQGVRPDRPLTRADVLDASQTAALLGVSRSTVLAWARVGYIPRRRLGRRWIFLQWELEDWLIAQRAPR